MTNQPPTWPANTRDELKAALSEICDALEEQELPFFIEQAEELNPDCFWISCEVDGYENAGFAGWSEDENQLAFVCFDPARANHDEKEGVDEDDSKCWWRATDTAMFILHLDGGVRDILKKDRERAAGSETEIA